jgi:hypothetical protein
MLARQAHNLKVAGSNPAPAPNLKPLDHLQGLFVATLTLSVAVCFQKSIEHRKVLVRELPDDFAQAALSHLADSNETRVCHLHP